MLYRYAQNDDSFGMPSKDRYKVDRSGHGGLANDVLERIRHCFSSL